MAKNIFVGFSTMNPSTSRSWILYDIDLIKADLMNNFMTRRGERLMRPDIGCSIWDYVDEPLTPGTVEAIEEEVRRVVSLDTRLELQGIEVSSYNNGIIVQTKLRYIPYNTVDSFRVAFESHQ